MRQIFYILFGAGLTVGSSVACGKALLRRTVPGLSAPETVFLGFTAGSGIVSLLVFGICAARLAHKGVILALATAILGTYGFQAARIRSSAGAQFRPALPNFKNPVLLGLNAILALFLVLYFFHALAPEISQDGSTYHLGLVARYLREHGFVPVTTNMYAGLPPRDGDAVSVRILIRKKFSRRTGPLRISGGARWSDDPLLAPVQERVEKG